MNWGTRLRGLGLIRYKRVYFYSIWGYDYVGRWVICGGRVVVYDKGFVGDVGREEFVGFSLEEERVCWNWRYSCIYFFLDF